jgi:hypothetical protein
VALTLLIGNLNGSCDPTKGTVELPVQFHDTSTHKAKASSQAIRKKVGKEKHKS